MRLLDVAARLFAERGYDGVSVRDLTRAAKVNLAAVTYHFKSKQGLFAAVIDEKTKPLMRIGTEIKESQRPPKEKLAALLAEYALFVLHLEPTLKAFFIEMLHGGEHLPPFARERLEWRNGIIGEILKDGIRRGDFRKCDVAHVTLLFFGLTMPYIMELPIVNPRYRTEPYPKWLVRHITEVALDLFMNGVLTKQARSRAEGCIHVAMSRQQARTRRRQ